MQLGEPELMASMACSGVAGADGEERGTGAEDVGHGSRLGFGLDPEKRGSGDGERGRSREQQGGLHLHDAGERGAGMARQGRRTRHGAAVEFLCATGRRRFCE